MNNGTRKLAESLDIVFKAAINSTPTPEESVKIAESCGFIKDYITSLSTETAQVIKFGITQWSEKSLGLPIPEKHRSIKEVLSYIAESVMLIPEPQDEPQPSSCGDSPENCKC
jgi:hypothetical protein